MVPLLSRMEFFHLNHVKGKSPKDEITTLAKNYLENETSDKYEVLKSFDDNKEEFVFLLIPIGTGDGRIWKSLGIIREEKEFSTFNYIKNEKREKSREAAIDAMKKMLDGITSEANDLWCNKSLSESLTNCLSLLPSSASSKEFLSLSLDEILINEGFSNSYSLKSTYKITLSSLRNHLEENPKYILPETQLKELSSKLISRNLAPSKTDSSDYRHEVLSLIAQLKCRGQIIDQKSLENVEKFCSSQKNCHLDFIKEFEASLEKDPRDNEAKISLLTAIKKRIMFLRNAFTLTQDESIFKNVDEVCGYITQDDNRLNCLRESLKLLNEELEKIHKIPPKNENETKANNDDSQAIDVSSEIRAKQRKICFILRRKKMNHEIEMEIVGLIKVLSNESERRTGNCEFSEVTIMKVIKLSESLENDDDIIAIINVLLLSDTQQLELNENFFTQIGQSYAAIVFRFGLEKKILNPNGFINFVFKMLCVDHSEHTKIHNEALKVFEKYENVLEENMKIVFALEKSSAKDGGFLRLLLSTAGKLNLTMNSFTELTKVLSEKEALTIVKILLNSDFQKLPNFLLEPLIKQAQTFLNIQSETEDKYETLIIIKLLMKGQYIEWTLFESSIINLLDSQKYLNLVLDMIFIAIQKGDKVSNKLVDKIKLLEVTTYTRNILKAITKTETALDIISDSRRNLSDRKLNLHTIENDKSLHNPYTARLLENLIVFNDPLKTEAFSALVKILPEKFEAKKYEIDCYKILLAIADEKVDDKVVAAFHRKRNQSTKPVTDKITSSNIGEVVRYLTKYSQENIELSQEGKTNILNALADSSLKDFYEKMVNVLYENGQAFGFTEIDRAFIFNLMKSNQKLAELKCMLDLTSLMRSLAITIPDDVIQLFWSNSLASDDDFKVKLLKLSSSIENISENITEIAAQMLFNDKVANEEVELYAAKIISRSVKISSSIVKKLENICLNKKKSLKVTKVCLQIIKTSGASEHFTNNFHKLLCTDLTKDDKISKILSENFATLTESEKFLRLKTFSNAILHAVEIKSELAKNFKSTEWNKTLLCLAIISKSKTSLNELELLSFRDNVDFLDDVFSSNSPSRSRLVENVLLKLLDVQEDFPLSFSHINDVLITLQSNNEAFDIFCKSQDFAKVIPEMKKIWLLGKFFPGPKYSDYNKDQVGRLSIHLNFNMNTINSILANVSQETTVEAMLKFFKRVSSYHLDGEDFVTSLKLKSGTSFEHWHEKLSELIVDEIVDKKLFDNKIVNTAESDKIIKQLRVNLIRILTPSSAFSGWGVRGIDTIVNQIKCDADIEMLCEAICPIYEFELKETDCDVAGRSLLSMLEEDRLDQLKLKIHELAIYISFKGTFNKSVDELLDEIKSLNSRINVDKIKTEFEEVIKAFENKSGLFGEKNIIKNWNENDVKDWATKAKTNKNVDKFEKLAVIKKAVAIFNKYELRDVQLLSVLLILDSEHNRGRLQQINTGEGKTTIVAMLAVFKALAGHSVDVITSSPELARPQSEQQSKFYQMFNLSVSHNGKDGYGDIKLRYKSDIVYGAAGDFQGDILRDEYSKKKTRSGRKCVVAIVDEVDSMLIDGRNYIVMLSSQMPAMNYLEPILAAIWIQVDSVAKCIVEENGQAYFISNEGVIGENGKIDDTAEDFGEPIEGSKSEFITDCTNKLMRKILGDKEFMEKQEKENKAKEEARKQTEKDPKEEPKEENNSKENFDNCPKLNIPSHLREFVLKFQLDKWIESAIYAKFRCENGKHYLLRDGKVVPVDSDNTGVVQQNTHWSNGIHQFLQIKHGAKITPEGITTNFISNVAFFKRYGCNVFGLTGTLGSENAKDLLADIYNVDNVIIPPFRMKQHKELMPIFAATEDKWYSNIVESSVQKLRIGRGVLVITKYIQEAKRIKELILKPEFKVDASKVKLYITEQDTHVLDKELKAGEIIIATNIAGRGTDIKPSANVEENGGLHVCVTFLPSSQRVEQQNFGRTSRTGNRGTSQFVLLDSQSSNLPEMKLMRNFYEENSLAVAKIKMKKILKKDEVFQVFCKLLDKFGKDHEKNAVEERFGLWMQMNAEKFEADEGEEPLKIFETFESEILEDSKKEKLIQNCCHFVKNGNNFLDCKKYLEAIGEYSKAIAIDENFSENAFYNRGYARIAYYGEDIKKYSQQINNAANDFQRAKEIIEERELELHIIQKASSSEAYSEQVAHKQTLYSIQKNVVEGAIGIKEIELNQQLTELKDQKKNLIESDKFKKSEQQIRDLEKQSKEKWESLYQNLFIGTTDVFSLIFVSVLTAGNVSNLSSDVIKKRDAAMDFIKEAKNKIDELKKSDEFLQIKGIDEQIKSLGERKDGTIKQARDNGNDLKIERSSIYKALPDSEDVSVYEDEINEFLHNGYIGAFSLSEKLPIPWGTIFKLAAIGLVQIVAGAALTVYSLGAGSSIGMSLITEGVTDLITAVKDGIINRNFDWKSWGIQKAISLTVSFLCAGFSAIKDAAKTAGAGIKQVATMNLKFVTQKSFTTGLKIAAQAVGTSIAKTVASEIASTLISYGVSQTIIPLIEEKVMELIEPAIQKALVNNPLVMLMLQRDSEKRNKIFESLISNEATKLLRTESSAGNSFTTIAQGIAKGVAQGYKHKNDSVSLAMDFISYMDTAKVLVELTTFVPIFLKDLDTKISQLAKDNKISEKKETSKSSKNVSQQQIDTQSTSSEASTTSFQQADIDNSNDGDINLKERDEEQVKLIKNLHDSKEICNKVSRMVSVEMTSMINNKFVSPLAHAATSYGVGKLTERMDDCLQNNIGNYQAERRIEFFQDKDRTNRIPKEHKQGMKDEVAKAKAKQIIDDVKNGGELGLHHTGPLSEVVERPIKILDEKGNVIRIVGEHLGGDPVEVQYFPPSKENPSGHYTRPGGESVAPSGRNNCLLDVVASQLGGDKKGSDLRSGLGENMTKNIDNLANQASDINRLEIFNQQALAVGGRMAVKPGETDLEGCIAKSINPEDSGGSYGYLCDNYPGRLGQVDINHSPPKSVYEGTEYANIDIKDMPCFAIRVEDHRGSGLIVQSTGSSQESKDYRKDLNKDLKDGNYWKALEKEIENTRNVCTVKGRPDTYNESIMQQLKYCRDANIKGYNKKLITGDQYNYLVNKFSLEKQTYVKRKAAVDAEKLHARMQRQ